MRTRHWICIMAVCLVSTTMSRPLLGQIAPPPEDLPTPQPQPLLPPMRAMLGIRIAEVTDSAVREFGLTDREGALITALLRGSPAERAGLPLGGVIVALDGERIASPEDLIRAIRTSRPGERVELKYYERNELMRKSIDLVPYVGSNPNGLPAPAQLVPRLPADRSGLPPIPNTDSLAELTERVADLRVEVDQLRQEVAQLKQMIQKLVEKQ